MKKIISVILAIILAASSALVLASCALAKSLEESLNVVFMNEGEIVANDTVTQFKNVQTPEISEAYVPDGYKFYGWTPYALNEVDPAAKDFKKTFIGGGKMLHYMDVKGFENNRTVVLNALIIDKELVPKEYHYVVLAWYDKVATSGISGAQMATLEEKLTAYLRGEGVSEEDIATIVIRGYSGNVGPSCGQIMADDDVDIMLGWGSASNVIDTGGMKPEMLLETVSYPVVYEGATKNRTIHRLSDTDTVNKVMAWLQSEDCTSIFN